MRQAAIMIAAQTNSAPLWAPVVRAILAPVLWWKRQRTLVRLIDLDDHILCDIGISREDVRQIAQLPLGVNADLVLQERALRRGSPRPRGWRQS